MNLLDEIDQDPETKSRFGIRKLRLQRFRTFASAQAAFSAHGINLVIGPAGSGKTAVLEALAMVLSQILDGTGAGAAAGPTAADVRDAPGPDEVAGAHPCRVSATVEIQESGGNWSWTLAEGAAQAAARRPKDRPDDGGLRPVAAFYREDSFMPRQLASGAGDDPLDAGRSFAATLEWLKSGPDALWDEEEYRPDKDVVPAVPMGLLNCALKIVFREEFEKAFWNPDRTQLLFVRRNRARPARLDELGGLRFWVCLLADLMRRVWQANPGRTLKELRDVPAIVLIDGFERGLDAVLQHRAAANLSYLLFHGQFIAATDSPMVVGEIRPGRVQLIAAGPKGSRIKAARVADGYSCDEILVNTMDSIAHSEKVEDLFRQFRMFMRQNALMFARDCLQEIEYEHADDSFALRQAYDKLFDKYASGVKDRTDELW